MRNFTPKILVLGAGGFGRQHLNVWSLLAREKQVEIAGVVVASDESRMAVERDYGLPATVGLTPALLEGIDGVDIVTPSSTHFELAAECLRHTNVLVEKPLALNPDGARELEARARRHSRVLMVNHVFRFDAVLLKLKELLASVGAPPQLIRGTFLQPSETRLESLSPNYELLHYFDAIDFLLDQPPHTFVTVKRGTINQVALRYPGDVSALLSLGWSGNDEKMRTLEFEYPDRKIAANFLDRSVTVRSRDSLEKFVVGEPHGALRQSLLTFLRALRDPSISWPDGDTGSRIVEIASRAMPGPRKIRPRVAVIGGGIFGASCALEFAPHAEVTLFERHSDLLLEASYQNQWRFHSGFHYPRSPQTVQEIQSTRDVFYSVFGDAVIDDVTSYYCTSKLATVITRERYLEACTQNRLTFEIEEFPPAWVDANRINLCLRTDESVFDLPGLRALATSKLMKHPNVELLLNSEVTDGRIDRDGRKRLTTRIGSKTREDEFDYLINTTYANNNIVSKWFNFPLRRLRFDYCEMVILEIPMPNICLTVLDGPFCSLVSTGRDNIFILTHVNESVLKSRITADGLPPEWSPVRSNSVNLIRQAARYFPVLENARYLESRFGVRTVEAFTEDYDGRPTVVTDHGFGCWSVLGGKIGSCVANADEILSQALPEAAGLVRPESGPLPRGQAARR
ncbi:MAG: FAD-dependent oxidoreductase [Terriglobia bacterium]